MKQSKIPFLPRRAQPPPGDLQSQPLQRDGSHENETVDSNQLQHECESVVREHDLVMENTENYESGEDAEDVSNADAEPGAGKKRTYAEYHDSWRNEYPWLIPVTRNDGALVLKCRVCKDAGKKSKFSSQGSDIMHKGAVKKHHMSNVHPAAQRLMDQKLQRGKMPAEKALEKSSHVGKSQATAVMQAVYYKALEGKSLEGIPKLLKFLKFMRTPNVTFLDGYGTYQNPVVAREMLIVISDYLRDELLLQIRASEFFALSIDESTDIKLDKHLIVHATFFSSDGHVKVCFLKLLKVDDANAETITATLLQLLTDLKLDPSKFCSIATDGASVMIGCKTGVVTRLKASHFPGLIAIHCIAHRQALASKDALEKFPQLIFIDKLIAKVYSWLGKSSKRHAEFAGLLDMFNTKQLKILKLHQVRWLSRGLVIARIVNVMPAVLEQWRIHNHGDYNAMLSYEVQFLLHFMGDVLELLNVLSKMFQDDIVDVSKIGTRIERTKRLLRMRYMTPGSFGDGSPRLSNFLKGSGSTGFMTFETNAGVTSSFPLQYTSIHHYDDVRDVNSLKGKCEQTATQFLMVLLQSLDDRFENLEVFKAMKLFQPVGYPEDALKRRQETAAWLDMLITYLKFQDNIKVQLHAEREGFVEELFDSCQDKSMLGAWRYCTSDGICSSSMFTQFSGMMKMWQRILVIPVSTATCERGFWKQNEIKMKLRSALSLETLDAHMFISLNQRAFEDVNWNRVEELWRLKKSRRG